MPDLRPRWRESSPKFANRRRDEELFSLQWVKGEECPKTIGPPGLHHARCRHRMGVMTFQLPADLAAADPLRQDLERASVAGGQDNMPLATEVAVEPGRLVLTRSVDE